MYYFLSFGSQWEKQQQVRVAKGMSRSYIVVEACNGTRVDECLRNLHSLFFTIPRVVAESGGLDMAVSTARFIMISCSKCEIHATIRFRRQNFPFLLFRMMDSRRYEEVLETPTCLHDELANAFLTEYAPR